MAKNLWKSGRSARGDSRDGGGEPQEPVEAPYEMVGTTLRHKREERGEDLRYVAQILRIRYPYLKAIEDGKPDELPGPTYAVGFVRTYAEHLGLDTEKLVQQFKEEAAGLQAKADLHFPAPLPEGKIPSGAVLIVAVLLAAGVYGAWMYLSSRDQQVAEIVPELPNQISEIIQGSPAETPAAAPEQSAAVTSPTAEVSPAEAMPSEPAAPDTPVAAVETTQATTQTTETDQAA
ncbi:MAG: helix-turn-helix domain-containing protein, partial [Pseudomonadota bacterium]